jgi:drug/metabolite transporter (DMT)-like permease
MGFVSQRFGMDLVGPFFFAGVRTIFAALTILLVIIVTGAVAKRKAAMAAANNGDKPVGRRSTDGTDGRLLPNEPGGERLSGETSDRLPADEPGGNTAAAAGAFESWRDPWIIKGGIVCGVVLFLGQGLQQVGIVYTSASKAGFLTALYIVIVPILGIFLKKHTHWNTWVSVPIAAIGLYFLSITAAFTILPGDLIMLIGSVMWAGHILVIDHFVPPLTQQGILKLVTIQFIACAALSFVCTPFIDMKLVPIPLTVDTVVQVMPALLYAGCISAGIGYTLQAIGQRHVSPAAAGLIMSLEAVFGAIGGALILGERLSHREALGCALLFVAVVFAQMPSKRKKDTNADKIDGTA